MGDWVGRPAVDVLLRSRQSVNSGWKTGDRIGSRNAGVAQQVVEGAVLEQQDEDVLDLIVCQGSPRGMATTLERRSQPEPL